MDPSPSVLPLSAATDTTTTNPLIYSDSVESSPRSRIVETWHDDPLPPVPGAKLRIMCSYGGHIMPRPSDKSLFYVGGDTRIVVVDRHSSLKDLCSRLSHTLLHGRPFTLKYQLPNEDLDNLITVTNDEDLENMIEEYDRIAASASPLKPSASRLRVFLFNTKLDTAVSMGSLLDDSKSETWFVDALNNLGILSRVVSDSAAVDSCLVNLDDGGPASGSSNNLDAQATESLPHNNKQVEDNSLYGSSYSSSSSSSMANLLPIRVCVDENGSRLQQEQRLGMEEQFAQMTFSTRGVEQDEGYAISSGAAMPAIPATATMNPAAMVTSDNMNRVVSDDDNRLDHGAYRKPPLPLQLVQPKTSGGFGLLSPDSVVSDSSIASANSFLKAVYYQEQVQLAAHVDNKTPALPNFKSEISDHSPRLEREQVQDSGYALSPQLDQNQQRLQFFIHHPGATGAAPMSSYYPVYAPPSHSQKQIHHPIGQQQYPVYVMPVGSTQPYNITLQPNVADPNVVAYKDGDPSIYPTKTATTTIPDVAHSVYKATVASNPAFVQIPSNQFQQRYVGLPQIHHPPHPIAIAPSATVSYGYEYSGAAQDQAYCTQQQTTALLPPQYQFMALSDVLEQFPIQQPNRSSQPV